MKQLIGITSPPYEEAVNGGGIFKKGYVGNFSHSKNPDTVGNMTYSSKTHNFSDGQIGSLKSQPNQELDFDITQYHKCGGELYWNGCYGSDTYYKQFVTQESFSHPAKASFLLIERIFKHLEHLGLLKEGMTVCDFMCGSGRINLLASLRGYDSVGVELEPHFIKMCEDNKKFAENKIGRKINFEIIQGDSRQLSKILNKGDVGVVSPPFTDMNHPTNYLGKLKKESCSEYSNNPENIGNLPYKNIVGITSPPFIDQNKRSKSDQEWRDKAIESGRLPKMGSACSDSVRYSDNPSNIGNLSYKDFENKEFSKPSLRGMVGVVSPPYQDSQIIQLKAGQGKDMKEHPETIQEMIRAKNYSQNPQNIGNLKDRELVGITSPEKESDWCNCDD